MKYIYKAVEKIPKQLEESTVYHSLEFELGALLCACGCRHKVMLLVPDSHQIINSGGFATVTPSIAVCDAPCRSHYFLNDGKVEWLPEFSATKAASVMRNQIARHATLDVKRRAWTATVWAAIVEKFKKIMSLIGL